MSTRFPSDDWARALADALNANDDYRRAADGWSPGLVALAAGAGAEDPAGRAVMLELADGSARAAGACPLSEARTRAALVLLASPDVWSALLSGSRDPIKALLCGDVKVTHGGLPTLVGHVFAYRELVATGSTLDAG